MEPIILASASSIRRQLMEAARIPFSVDPADIDEEACREPSPSERARQLAIAKAKHVAKRHPGRLCLGSDQVFSLGGEFFSKPTSIAAVEALLLRMNGRTHEFNCGIALVRDGDVVDAAVETARVTFLELSADEIRRLAATGEGIGCAGGYQLECGGVRLIKAIDGSHFTVLGLPMLRLCSMLRSIGLTW